MLRPLIGRAASAAIVGAAGVGAVGTAGSDARAAVAGPYTADADTLHLYHFSEASGDLVDSASFNPYPLTNTGGVNGRDNNAANGGGYGAPSFTGFGTAFNPINSGNGAYNANTSATGGGAGGGAVAANQSFWNGSTGAFTWEALVAPSTISGGQKVIVSQDSGTTRGAILSITGAGVLELYNGGSSTPTNLSAAIPTAGPHAFVANQWFHAAAAYTGEAGVAGNLKFYWTRVDGAATEANLIGTGTLAGDLSTGAGNPVFVGGASRNPFRFETDRIDEVRISGVARGPGDFVFVPEPAGLGLLAAGAAVLGGRRRRRPARA